METKEINNLISFVVCSILEGDKEAAILAAEGLNCPRAVKAHIIAIFTSCDNVWD